MTPILLSSASGIPWGGRCSLVFVKDLFHPGSRCFLLLFSYRNGSAGLRFHPTAGAGHHGAAPFFLEPLYFHYFHEGFLGRLFRIVFNAPNPVSPPEPPDSAPASAGACPEGVLTWTAVGLDSACEEPGFDLLLAQLLRINTAENKSSIFIICFA